MDDFNNDGSRYFQWDELYSPNTPNTGLEDWESNGSRSDYSSSPHPGYQQFATPSPVMEPATIQVPDPQGPYFDLSTINAQLPQLLAQLQSPAAQQALYNIVQQLPYG
ncbi:11771_t:CDS:1, partial [Acaulospora colombiana]